MKNIVQPTSAACR